MIKTFKKNSTILFLCALVVCGFSCSVLGAGTQQLGGKAQQKILELTDGSFKRGWLIRDGKGKKFIDITGDKMDVPAKAKFLKIPELEKEFLKQQRDVRKDEDDRTAEYAKLFPWGQERQLYESVEQLADKLIKRSPSNPLPAALKAKEWARGQLDVMRKTRSAGLEDDGWTMERVQQIRFALVGTGAYDDSKPRITFRSKVIERFLAEMAEIDMFTSKEQQRDFRQAPSIVQLRIIKRETGNKYQPDIMISTDPPLMRDFKTRVLPLLARSCAKSSCHGGQNVKFPMDARPKGLPQIYASYYALDTFTNKDGAMIDHIRPDIDSLLFNYLVAPDIAPAQISHFPAIPPLIRSKEDVRFAQLENWFKLQPAEPINVLLGESDEKIRPTVAVGGKPQSSDKADDATEDATEDAEPIKTVPTGKKPKKTR